MVVEQAGVVQARVAVVVVEQAGVVQAWVAVVVVEQAGVEQVRVAVVVEQPQVDRVQLDCVFRIRQQRRTSTVRRH